MLFVVCSYGLYCFDVYCVGVRSCVLLVVSVCCSWCVLLWCRGVGDYVSSLCCYVMCCHVLRCCLRVGVCV